MASSAEEVCVCVADVINVKKTSIASAIHIMRDKETPSSEVIVFLQMGCHKATNGYINISANDKATNGYLNISANGSSISIPELILRFSKMTQGHLEEPRDYKR